MFRKPLIQWREPLEVRRARRRRERQLRVLKKAMVLCFVLGGIGILEGCIRGLHTLAGQTCAVMGLFAVVGAWSWWGWFTAGGRYRFALHAKGSRRNADLWGRIVAAGIVRHPLMPRYRALLTIDRSGSKRFIAIPDEATTEEIRRVWPESQTGQMPLQTGAGIVPAMDDSAAPGRIILVCPDPPQYWPTAYMNRRRVAWAGAALLLLPVTVICLFEVSFNLVFQSDLEASVPQLYGLTAELGRLSVVLILIYGAFLSVAWAIGAVFGWNASAVLVGQDELCFFALFDWRPWFAWEDVKEVILRVSPYADRHEEIEVTYTCCGVEAVFTKRLGSRRLDYEQLSKALAIKTDMTPQVTETADGITIRLTGFAEKATGQRRMRE